MTQVSEHFMSPIIEEKVFEVFIKSVKNTKSSDEVINFLNDLLTPVEKIMLAKWDDYRTVDWLSVIDCPDVVLQQTRQHLSV